MLCLYRKFETYVKLNRWEYDPERLIPISCLNPMRSRKYDRVKSISESKEFYTDGYGAATGARVTDSSGALRSVRNIGKNKKANPPAPSIPAATPKKKATTKKVNAVNATNSVMKTVQPKWTRKLSEALTKAVEKNTSTKGVSWVAVVEAMQISKHHCRNEWQRILKEREESTSSGGHEGLGVEVVSCSSPEVVLVTNGSHSGSAPAAHTSSSDGKADTGLRNTVMKLFEAQTAQLMTISANQVRIADDCERTKALAEKTSSKVALVQGQLQNSRVSSHHANGLSNVHDTGSSNVHDGTKGKRKRKTRHSKKKKRHVSPSRPPSRPEITENDLIQFEKAASQADLVCSLTKETNRLRFLQSINK